MNLAGALRRELIERARRYAEAHGLPYCLSYGDAPGLCFTPYENDLRHGNFLPPSYTAIRRDPLWRRRLTKVHTLGKRTLPRTDRGRWMELDSCTSSDALLMNVFGYPGILRACATRSLPGLSPDRLASSPAIFGYKACVPLAQGRRDRTEVDLRIGNLLIEAKLTESGFQSARKIVMAAYRDFADVFDVPQLPQTADRYLSYQLLRNVLAAYALQCTFCLLVDERRPDLIDAWYAVVRCVKPIELRTELRVATWQEVAAAAPVTLRRFLAEKYGIGPEATESGNRAWACSGRLVPGRD